MKKYILCSLLTVFILSVFICFYKFIYFDGRMEEVSYPKQGLVCSSDMAIELSVLYINKITGLQMVNKESFIAKYDKRLNAWIVKTKTNEDPELLGKQLVLIINRTNAKVMLIRL